MKKNIFKLLELIVAAIAILVCLGANAKNGYEIMFLLPLTYLVCRILLNYTKNDYKKNFAYLALDFLTLIKYVIMPILVVTMEDYYGGVLTSQVPASRNIRVAIILLVLECIAIFSAVAFYRNSKTKIRLVFKRSSKKRIVSLDSQITKKIKFNPPMFIFFAISILFIVKYLDAFLPYKLFVIDSEYTSATINSSLDGLITIIFYLFKLFIMLYTIQFFVIKYKKKNSFLYIVGILCSLILYLGLNTSTSRWAMVVPTFVVFYMLRDIWFKNTRNKIVMGSIIIALLISFVSISLYKFNWLFDNREISEVTAKEVTTILASQIQEYFSGPRAVAQGIEAEQIYGNKITIGTMINDFTGSIPFISKFVDQSNRINIYYNYYLKGVGKVATQIMPMISIGYSYFSIVLCYIFTIISILLSLYCGKVASEKNDLFRKYIYCYLSFWLAMCVGFNTQIIFGWFISNFIPFILVLKVNDIFVLKKQ